MKPFCSLFTSAQSGGIVGIRVGFQGFREQLRPLKAQLKEGIRAGAEELQKRIKEGTLGGSAGGLQKMTFAAPCAWGPAFLCRSSVSPANPHLTLSVHGDRGADDDADSCQESPPLTKKRHRAAVNAPPSRLHLTCVCPTGRFSRSRASPSLGRIRGRPLLRRQHRRAAEEGGGGRRKEGRNDREASSKYQP